MHANSGYLYGFFLVRVSDVIAVNSMKCVMQCCFYLLYSFMPVYTGL